MGLRRRSLAGVIRTLAATVPIFAAAFGVSILFTPLQAAATQTVPYLINFQGKLTDNNGNVLSDGNYNIKFRLFTVSSGGSNIWEEDHIYGASDNRVAISGGLFDIQLGTLTSISPSLFNLASQGSLYLEVELPTPATSMCASNGCAAWTEGAMTPRQPLSSSPYAFNSQTLDGLDSSAFGQLSAANTWTGANLFAPTTSSTVALTVAASTAGGSDALDVKNSSGVQTANFDASGSFNTTTINSLSSGGTLTTDAATLQRVATGTFTLDLKDSASTTLAVTNSGAGVANLNVVKGDVETAGVSRLTNAGSLQNIVNITQSGTFLSQNTTDSTSAFQVLTSSGAGSRDVLEVGTSNTQVSLDADLLVNSSVAVPSITSIAYASNTTGSLSGASGTTYFYRISAIVGSETAASGESWVSSDSFSPLAAPSAPTVGASTAGGSLNASSTYHYEVTYVTANGETVASTASGAGTTTNTHLTLPVTVPTYGGPAGVVTARKLYRTQGGGSTYFLVNTGATLSNNTTTAFNDGTADSSLGAAPPSANTATTNLNSVTVTFPAFPSATSYRIYRGTSSLGENAYQTTGSCTTPCTFTDNGAAGTSGTPINPTAGRVGIGNTAPGYALDVNGNINADNAFIQNGNVGQTSSCGSGNTYSGITVSGGIVTSVGACTSIGGGSASATLQSAYANSTIPQIDLSAAGGTLTVRDTATGLGTDLFDVQDNAGTNTYLGVSATGISVTGSGSFSTGVSIGAGQSYTGSGAVTLNSGAASGLTLDATNGTLVFGSNTTTLQKAASALAIDLTNAGTSTLTVKNSNGANVANLSVSGTINGATISGGTVSGGNLSASAVNGLSVSGGTVSVGTWQATAIGAQYGGTGQSSYTIGDMLYAGTTTSLSKLSETGTAGQCLISGATGSGPSWGSCSSAAGANTSLSNLVATSINQSLVPNANNTLNLGSAGAVWATAYAAAIDAGTTTTTLDIGTTNATTITVGNTTAATATDIQGGSTGGVNIGSVGSSTASSTTNIATTSSATGTQTVSIGSNANAANALTLDAGNTGQIQVGNSSSAHTILIGAGGAAAGNSQTITIGSITTTTASKLLLQAGNINTTNSNSGIVLGNGFSTTATGIIPLVLSSDSNYSSDETASNCTASVNGGAMYFNSTSDSVRICQPDTAAWQDLPTSADLGMILFGVVPTSGPAPGDWVGVNATLASKGPCKVYMGSATNTVRWTACTAYSGGRKVVVTAQATDVTVTTGNGVWAKVCLNGTNDQPTVTNSVTETTGFPTWSATAPVLCLADISTTNAAGGHITEIYDTRTFTTTTKELVNGITTIPALGMIAQQTATAGEVTRPAATAALGSLVGVYVASAGNTTAGTINAIVATAGPAYVKSTAGTITNDLETGTGTAGYAITTATVPAPTIGYGSLGVALSAFSSTCGANADTCRGSLAVNLAIR